jgi:WhiB family transcriptional regulator, redox-sensing transcriptional regulator
VSALATSVALANADYYWRLEAACRDTQPDLFFPVGTTGQALVQIENAKQVCRKCPVQQECLDFALTTNQDSGIWGGTSEEERRKLRRAYVARERQLRAAAAAG